MDPKLPAPPMTDEDKQIMEQERKENKETAERRKAQRASNDLAEGKFPSAPISVDRMTLKDAAQVNNKEVLFCSSLENAENRCKIELLPIGVMRVSTYSNPKIETYIPLSSIKYWTVSRKDG